MRRRFTVLLLLAIVAASALAARADSRWERQQQRYRQRLKSARFAFPGKGGEWEISYPPMWTKQEDPRADTCVFMSQDGRIRLLLTRRILNPKVQGSADELEAQNLEIGRQLAQKMAKAAGAPPKFTDFINNTCRGMYYQLRAKHPHPGDFPYVVGISAVKDRFHLVGYFQMSDRAEDVQAVVYNMIKSISFGPPPK